MDVDFCSASGEGLRAVSGADVLGHLAATGGVASPAQVAAALKASQAYVSEFYRSNGKSTDAPWDWPKTDDDIKIINADQERALKRMMGG